MKKSIEFTVTEDSWGEIKCPFRLGFWESEHSSFESFNCILRERGLIPNAPGRNDAGCYKLSECTKVNESTGTHNETRV